MRKVLDTSAVSVMSRNIMCTDLLSILEDNYEVVVTPGVIKECSAYEGSDLGISTGGAQVLDDQRMDGIVQTIRMRYPMLGSGECASMAASLILTAEGIPNYVVLDDNKARKVASTVGNLPEIEAVLGKDLVLNITGTIGMVLHLREKGLISEKDKQDIGYELERSDFRISRELLGLLR